MVSEDQITSNTDPGFNCSAITPHVSNPIRSSESTNGTAPCRGIYVGVGGDITLRAKRNSTDTVFVGVPQGSILPVAATHVRAAGTTASSLVALW
jgi:hypothetical protein